MRRLVLSLLLTLLFVIIKSSTIPKGISQQQTTEPIIYGIVPEDVQSLQPVIVTPTILSGDSNHDVCEYKLEPRSSGSSNVSSPNVSVPFRVLLQDKKTGSALLLVSEGSQLDYEKINHYELELLTVFCDRSVPITRRQMSIRVTDVNEFAPEWKGQGYVVEVPEGKLFDAILKVEAADKDGSEQYSTICRYKLTTEGVPFAMDDKGHLKNTEPLNYKQRHNYILEVVAEDCGGLASKKAFVNILITEKCQPGWEGLKKWTNYNLPSGGPALLVDPKEASLKLCDLADNCTIEQVTIALKLLKMNGTLRLDSDNVPVADGVDVVAVEMESTCDLDARSVERRLETCEPELGMIDLLNPELLGDDTKVGGAPGSPMSFNGSSAYNIKTFKLVDDVYKDYLVQERKINNVDDTAKGKGDGDGAKGVETIVMTREGPNSEFGISMWMKRDYEDAFPKSGRDEKQSVLCSSDGEGMSRNHVTLFLHNCHLVVMARFEPSGRHIPDVLKKIKKSSSSKLPSEGSDASEEVAMRNEDDEFYRPSEWHWKLDQTCDNKWHHYAVNIDQNKARLFVDGNLFINTPRNPVTLEDHALHLSKKVHSTKLTVGACWKGLTQSYGDHFRGHLAELRVLRRSLLKETTVKCISNCNEKLDFHSINEMESGMSISMNSQMTELTINGRTKASVEHLLSTVGYSNPRMNFNPAVGDFTSPLTSVITFHTSLKCTDETYPRLISKESMEIHLVPSKGQPQAPLKAQDVVSDDSKTAGSSLFISGTQRLDYAERDVGRGIPVFRDVDIYRYPPERDLSYEELIKGNPRTKDIESCTVRVSPAMDEEVEDVTHPQALAYKNHLRVDSSLEGLIVKGPSRAKDFVEILKKINYIHKRPEDLNKKIFVLFCHDGEGKKSKDDLVVELNAIHFEYPDDLSQRAGHIGQNKFVHPVVNGPQKGDGLQVEKFSDTGSKEQSRTGNASVVATITLCVCVLMVVISVGMYRVFFHRQKTVKVHVDNQQEPQWDRSTITITVNPLETAALKEEDQSEKENGDERAALDPAAGGYYDDDDDIGSAHEMMRDTEEEEEEDEEDDGEKVKKGTKYSDEDASKINHFVMSDTE